MTGEVKITKRFVDAATLPPEKAALPPSQAYHFYWDSELPGFGLKVTGAATNNKTYVAQSRVNGKTRRATIGKHGVLTPDEARKRAKSALFKMSEGVDVTEEKRRPEVEAVTLGELVERYLKRRTKLSDDYAHQYRKMVGLNPPPKKLCLGTREPALYVRDWKDKPIVEITKDMIMQRHSLLGKRSEASANQLMRMMRALFTFAEDEYEKPNGDSLISANPVRRLSRQRAWYELQPRKTYVKDEQLEAWWRAVEKMHSDVPRACFDQNKDYLRLILFTGLRLDEAAGLRCEDVDMKVKVFIVRDPKNGRDHALPVTDYLYQLFSRRLANARALGSPFVFPGPGKSGHMGGAKDFVHKVCEEAEIKFTLHDLRRTFATMAHGLDVRTYSIKRLLNHKMKGDVTFEHYLIIEAETLRVPMQKITDRILKLVGERKSAKVVKMPRAPTKAA